MLLTKPVDRPKKKSCCSDCKQGKPCCGKQDPAGGRTFQKRGDLWLPDSRMVASRRSTHRGTYSRAGFGIPQAHRQREFIRRVERFMPTRRVDWWYGSGLAWWKLRNLLMLPPDMWGSVPRWNLPLCMPVYDMSCSPCCSGCCCDLPGTLTVTLTPPGGSHCTACAAFATALDLTAQSTVSCPLPTDTWTYLGADSGGCFSPVFDFFFCNICELELECVDGSVSLTASNLEAAAGCVTCGGVLTQLEVADCDPFTATGEFPLSASDVSCICAGCDSLEDAEVWEVAVNE